MLCNGADDIRISADNATYTTEPETPGTVVRPRYFTQGNNFITFAGDLSDPDIVYLSGGAPDPIYEYDSNNNQNIDLGNSYNVTGVLSLGAQIIITKANQTYKTDLASLSTVPLDFSGGCKDHRGLVQTQQNEIYIPSSNGVYAVAKTQIGSNSYFGNPESEIIRRLWRGVLDTSKVPGWFLTDFNQAIWSSDTTFGRLTFVKMLDYTKPTWTYFTGINASQFTTYKDSDDKDHYLFADQALDKVWELGVGFSDTGAAINSTMAFKNDDFGSPGQLKHVAYVDVFGWISEFAEWNVEMYKNDESIPFITKTITKDNYLNNAGSFGGLGVGALGKTPLGGIAPEEGIEVKAFGFRINVLENNIEKMQIVLYNTQADVRTVFKAIRVYYEPLPLDDFPNHLIA